MFRKFLNIIVLVCFMSSVAVGGYCIEPNQNAPLSNKIEYAANLPLVPIQMQKIGLLKRKAEAPVQPKGEVTPPQDPVKPVQNQENKNLSATSGDASGPDMGFLKRVLGWLIGVPVMIAKIPVILVMGAIEDTFKVENLTQAVANFGDFLGPNFTSFLIFSNNAEDRCYNLGNSKFLQALNNAALPFLSTLAAQMSFYAALFSSDSDSTLMKIIRFVKNDAKFQAFSGQSQGKDISFYEINKYSDYAILGLFYFVTLSAITYINAFSPATSSVAGGLVGTRPASLAVATVLLSIPVMTATSAAIIDSNKKEEVKK